MRRIVIHICLLFGCQFCRAQDFATYPNGLIYSDETMKQLAVMIDSLNTQFQQLRSDKIYYSKSQARAHYVHLAGPNAESAKLDIENKMPFEAFIKKYPEAEVYTELLVVRSFTKNSKNEDEVEFKTYPEERELSFSKNIDLYSNPKKGEWIANVFSAWSYHGNSKGQEKKSLTALYFLSDLTSRPIPDKYAQTIRYADYMIDTASIFRANATKDRGYNSKEGSKIKAFDDFVNEEFEKVDPESKIRKKSSFGRTPEWEALESRTLDKLSKGWDFQQLLKEAVAETLEKGGSHNRFEFYVSLYYSKEVALELKRRRRVIGMCGQDRAPNYHAMNIALLAAETANREIFLRTHLNVIVNTFPWEDYFYGDEESDTTIEKKRVTNVLELEELKVDVASLLQGIFLDTENPSKNHYKGLIYQVQPVLAGMKNSENLEQLLLTMLQDEELDDYNRLWIFELLKGYYHFYNDASRLDKDGELLKKVVQTLPEYLRTRIEL